MELRLQEEEPYQLREAAGVAEPWPAEGKRYHPLGRLMGIVFPKAHLEPAAGCSPTREPVRQV